MRGPPRNYPVPWQRPSPTLRRIIDRQLRLAEHLDRVAHLPPRVFASDYWIEMGDPLTPPEVK